MINDFYVPPVSAVEMEPEQFRFEEREEVLAAIKETQTNQFEAELRAEYGIIV